MHHCCLCGISLVPGMKRRFQKAEELSAFIRARCKPSPFLYQRLLLGPSEHEDPVVTICIPCVNWKRRVETCGLRRTRQPMLQLDQLICFLMRPGPFTEPDHRCMERLVVAGRDEANPYRGIFPAPVRSILDAVRDNTFRACVASWWTYNDRTEFFASGQEARRVRNALKTGHVQ
jgi:hypothetical protein